MQHLHDRQAGVETDEVGELQRAHRMIGAELHGRVDGIDGADAFIERVDRLVDHRQQDAVDDEGRKIFGDGDGLVEMRDEFLCRLEGLFLRGDTAYELHQLHHRAGFMKWMPMNRSGRSVAEASRVMDRDDVLVARIASGLMTGQTCP